jgi:competence protein ComEC
MARPRRRGVLRVARAVPGWAGVWLAVAVLSGWSSGHGLAVVAGDFWPGEVTGARRLMAVGAWSACALGLAVCGVRHLARRRDRRAGGSATLLGAWFALGLLAGVRGADIPPPHPLDAVRLPAAGERAWFLVRVDTVEEALSGARWSGTLQAWTAAGGWVRPRAPIVIGGTWNGAARRRYVIFGSIRGGPGVRGPLSVRVERAWSVEVTSGAPLRRPAAGRAARWRARFGERLVVAFGPDAGILAARTFLGPDTPMPAGWDTPFRLTGTMHLLSISGFHFSLLGGVLLLAMRMILRGARWAKWPAIWLLGGYAWMVGAPAPVQRSWGGALLLAAGPSWGRAGRTVNALGLVAALLPLLQPRLPAGPSFVLSFAATAGVILGARAITAWLDAVKDAPRTGDGRTRRPVRPGSSCYRLGRGIERARPLLLALGVSVGATLLTVPWSFHWFGLLYPLGVLANLVAIPAMAVVMAVQVPALVAVAAGAGSAFPFCVVGRLGGESFLAILRGLAPVTGVWAWMGPLDRVTSLAWLVAAGVAMLAVGRRADQSRARLRRGEPKPGEGERDRAAGDVPTRRAEGGPRGAVTDKAGETVTGSRRRWPAAARVVTWGLLLLLPVAAGEARRIRAEGPFRKASLDLRFLDVGQGDATLVRIGGATWLVDFGLGSMRGRDRLVPQLLRAGVTRLDRAWLTHADADHWGGLVDLLGSPVRLDTLVLGEGAVPPEKMLAALRSAPHPPVVVRAAAGWNRWGPALSVRVLHPPRGLPPGGTNEGSMVLLLESVPRAGTSPFKVLLSGDLPRGREEAVLASGRPGPVLVAELAHHGSRTSGSPAWWEETRPRLAVISVGRGNSYGLPHAETLASAARAGTTLLRTDRDGAVRIAFGANGASVARSGPS